jgi:hypothetical protein
LNLGFMRKRVSRSTGDSPRVVLAAVPALGALAYWLHRRRGHHRRRDRGPVTQALVLVQPADMDLGVPGRNTEQRLDEAIHETFPASDPVAISIE